MTHAQRAKLRRLAKARPRYLSGPKKGKFKPVGSNPRRGAVRRAASGLWARTTRAVARGARKVAKKARKVAKKAHARHRRDVKTQRRVARRRVAKTARSLGLRVTRRKPAVKKIVKRKKTRRNPATRTGGTAMAKKKVKKTKKVRKARKAAAPRKHKMTKHARSLAAKKGWRKRKAKAAHKAAAPRRRKAAKKTVRKTRRRRPLSFLAAPKPRSRKRRLYTVRRKAATIKDRAGHKHRYYRYTVKHNDAKSMLMQGLGLFGGFYGMKLVNGLLKQYVTSKIPGMPATIAPVLPAVGGFALALLAPKVIKGKPALVGAIQAGATIALFDTIVKAFVLPKLPPTVSGLLAGIDDVGYGSFRGFGYPSVGEYVPQLPGSLSDYGIEAHEAMALDEYVQERSGMGFDVNEALADSEVQGFQSGYAAGSLAKTVFSV